MTSFTSYGLSVSLNFLLATRNFRILLGRGISGRCSCSHRGLFQSPLLHLCPGPGHLLGPLSPTPSAGSPSSLTNTMLPFALHIQGLACCFLICLCGSINLGGRKWPCLLSSVGHGASRTPTNCCCWIRGRNISFTLCILGNCVQVLGHLKGVISNLWPQGGQV